MASTVMALVLVPSLAVMRRGMETARDVESLQAVNVLCLSKMEEQLAIAAATFANGTDAGNFSAQGHADIRYSATRSDAGSDGGIPDRLMAITLLVWQDSDGDGNFDSGELSAQLATKVAKMAVYQSDLAGA